MTTVVTRILHKLRIGNDAGRVATDERGQNVWQWKKSSAEHDNTSMLIKSLDNDDLQVVDSTAKNKAGTAANPEAVRSADVDGDSGGGEINLALAEDQQQGLNKPSSDDAAFNKYGKKVDDDGGFNPYG